jgi:hypothetical protein
MLCGSSLRRMSLSLAQASRSYLVRPRFHSVTDLSLLLSSLGSDPLKKTVGSDLLAAVGGLQCPYAGQCYRHWQQYQHHCLKHQDYPTHRLG